MTTRPSGAGFRATGVRLCALHYEAGQAPGEGTALVAPVLHHTFQSRVERATRTITVVASTRSEARPGALFSVGAAVEGTFQWTEPVPVEIEEFARRNAAAFMWPYLREAVWNLTVRSGFPPLILPVLNLATAEVEVLDAPDDQQE